MIAEHALLVGREADCYRLMLDSKHQSLLNGGDTAELQSALSGLLGNPVRLVVEVGELRQETPARRKQRLAAERQAAARRRLEQNATVKSLIEAFDGRLEEVRLLSQPGDR